MSKKQGILKVALLQYCATGDKEANLALAAAMSQEAIERQAKFILLPEVFNFRVNAISKECLAQAAEKIPGVSSNTFIQLAKKHKVSFLLGSIIEETSKSRFYNTSIFIDSRGVIRAKYRKIHLFDARIGDKIIKEADIFLSGRAPKVVNVEGFRAGLSICYDVRFPDLYQKYAHAGADILTVPSCFTKETGEAHWETLLRARAIENLAYILAPNQIGADNGGKQAYGHSMIVSPWGDVIAQGGTKQEIILGEISLEHVREARRKLPGIIK